MFLEMAIGDAYGAGFEYAPADFVKQNNTLTAYVKHPKHSLAPGSYTDDTQMSIANAEGNPLRLDNARTTRYRLCRLLQARPARRLCRRILQIPVLGQRWCRISRADETMQRQKWSSHAGFAVCIRPGH